MKSFFTPVKILKGTIKSDNILYIAKKIKGIPRERFIYLFPLKSSIRKSQMCKNR